jgi:hypothetical protein
MLTIAEAFFTVVAGAYAIWYCVDDLIERMIP